MNFHFFKFRAVYDFVNVNVGHIVGLKK